MKDWWHFHVWKQFNNKIFKQTLTEQDIASKPFFLETVQKVNEDGTVDEEPVNKQFIKIDKNGRLFLIPKEYIKDMPLNPIETIDCYLKPSDKTIYKLILQSQTARIVPKKTIPLKRFIHEYNPVEHSNPKTKEFLNMLVLATEYKPTQLAICSNPSSGKTSGYNISKNIVNHICIQRSPTLAVLETILYYNKTLILEELSSLTTSEVRQIEPVIFLGGDGSPDMQKHSIAKNKEMNNIDMTELSIIFPHNRPQDLQVGSKFMMDIWKNPKAFRSRFPCILVEGEVLSKISKPGKKQAIETMEAHYQEMLIVSKNFLYYTHNLKDEMHGYNRTNLKLLDARQYPNIEGLIDVIDAYCDTQIEFNEWIEWLNGRMLAYQDMLSKSIIDRKKYHDEDEIKLNEEYVE